MPDDRYVCFIGDSFIAGTGDPERLGWVGRIAARTHPHYPTMTAYNLGVRRQTSKEVRARLRTECAPRLPAEFDCRVVVSFGVNDTASENGTPRVSRDESIANLANLLEDLAACGWAAFVVGPPPLLHVDQNRRIALLDDGFSQVCGASKVTYVDVFKSLSESPDWFAEIQNGDGGHPGAGGYRHLADLVWPQWIGWLSVD
jgi:acyl-CoA thioesterase-1